MQESATINVAWGDARRIAEVYGVSKRTLALWRRNGWIRTAKLGEAKSARTLYAAADIEDTLDSIARGKEPDRPKRGRPRKRR